MTRRIYPADRAQGLHPWRRFVVLAIITLIVNLPVILMILNAFQTTEALTTVRSLIPQHPTLANFRYLNERTAFWTYLKNSMIVSGGATVLSVVAAALAGYALSRFKSAFLTLYARSLFVVQMFPIILALIPLFILFRNVGLINNPLSVIIVYTVVQLPFATWMARSFFDTIRVSSRRRHSSMAAHLSAPSCASSCRCRVRGLRRSRSSLSCFRITSSLSRIFSCAMTTR